MIGKKFAGMGNHRAGGREIVWTKVVQVRSESKCVATCTTLVARPVTPPGKGRRTDNRT